jgi:glycosyltransferase involved in cell wall biosynthesis
MPTEPRLHAVHTVSTLRADYGGPGRSITALCSALSAHSDVDLISFGWGPGEEPPVLPKVETVKVLLLQQRRPLTNVLTSARRFGKAIEIAASRTTQARVIHDHGMWLRTNHATATVARRLAVPRVVSPRGMISSWALEYHKVRKRLAWHLYQGRDLRAAQLLHATSAEEADDARRLGLRIPVAVIPNGVELPTEPPGRRRTSIDRQALFLSRIHPKKGVLELIAAWSRVRPPNWTLVIAGPDDGGHRAVAEELVRREGLDSVVRFVGSVPNDDKWAVYASADLFILPTYSENFGIAIAEALGTGIPVITTRGAPWRVLEQKRLGWWIDIGVEPLVAAIRDATSVGDEERRRLGRRGREYVESEFSWDRMGERMAAAYRWLCGAGPQPNDIQRD